ncbi:protein MULTIPLE CHLOROPLAST DIVISION SITE 1-like isoform X3 [Gossypium australe]|uniref:Protein MULTIPLE CHLOROPLAST DIVISION SITE 1-like isoform X3 n=1 Tax=Gossypium australe TaxID=47621 RepID=A0A5B6X7K4_9ROSI|nr:protein MULTIPLE CHLOROPLAST DIVISION SITE 1-like isoform X3 [Gossypium australe]
MASIWLLQFPGQPSIWGWKHRVSLSGTSLLLHHRHSLSQRLNWIHRTFSPRAIDNSVSSEEDLRAQNEVVDTAKHTLAVDSKHPLALFQESITSFPPVVFLVMFTSGYLYSV